MNHKESYNTLKNRVEWQKPLSTSSDKSFDFIEFKEPESGRFLQEEHTSVRIPIIYEALFNVDILDSEFSEKLEYIKEKAILQMLHDVFYDRKKACINWVGNEENVGIFDYAIILKLTSNVMADVMGSTRTNLTESITGENLKRWFIDLNGLKKKESGVYKQGYTDRYKQEVLSIRKALFLRNKSLKVITAR